MTGNGLRQKKEIIKNFVFIVGDAVTCILRVKSSNSLFFYRKNPGETQYNSAATVRRAERETRADIKYRLPWFYCHTYIQNNDILQRGGSHTKQKIQ